MYQILKSAILKLPFIQKLYNWRLSKIRQEEEEEKARKIKAWNSLFINQDYRVLFEVDGDTSIYLFKNSVLSRLIYEGHFELEEVSFVKGYLQAGDIFLDVGSNIGLFSLIASKAVGESGKVIAFEPSPATFERLKLNTTLAKFNNIDIRNIGLSDRHSTLTLKISGAGYDAWDTFADVEETSYVEKVEVEVSTLDEQLENVSKNKIALVKIDVEGWEKFVLLGGETFLKNYAPTLMVEFTDINTRAAGYEVTEIYDLLVSWGYEWYTYKNSKLVSSKRKSNYPYENLIAKKVM